MPVGWVARKLPEPVAQIAQSAEHFTRNEKVAGSIPALGSTRCAPKWVETEHRSPGIWKQRPGLLLSRGRTLASDCPVNAKRPPEGGRVQG